MSSVVKRSVSLPAELVYSTLSKDSDRFVELCAQYAEQTGLH